MTSTLALGAGASAQEPELQTTPASPVETINAWLPQPMSEEQARKVAEAVKSLQQTTGALRAHPLPEGSEPAFTFHPVRVGKRSR